MKKLIALSLVALGMVNIANAVVNCAGGCNYGTPSNPNWVYITWQCSDGQNCSLNCVNNPPTGGCTSGG